MKYLYFPLLTHFVLKSIFLRFHLFIFRERGREGEKEGEKHQCVVAFHKIPTGDLACHPGMCLDQSPTGDPLVYRWALNLLSHTSQDLNLFYLLLLYPVQSLYVYCSLLYIFTTIYIQLILFMYLKCFSYKQNIFGLFSFPFLKSLQFNLNVEY